VGGASDPPLGVNYRLPFAKIDGVRIGFIGKSGLNLSLFLSALIFSTSF
jgi:hypothetical protein